MEHVEIVWWKGLRPYLALADPAYSLVCIIQPPNQKEL